MSAYHRISAAVRAALYLAAGRAGIEAALSLHGWRYYVVIGLAAWVSADGMTPLRKALWGAT